MSEGTHEHEWDDWGECKFCHALRPCLDRSHGITCLDEFKGTGAYCRICGGPVLPDDVHARTVLERLRHSVNALEKLMRDAPEMAEMARPWTEKLKRAAGDITGKPESKSPEAPLL